MLPLEPSYGPRADVTVSFSDIIGLDKDGLWGPKDLKSGFF